MTLIVLILSILTCFAATDLFTAGHKRLHDQIYELAFFITFFLFTIKYYYGADALFYNNLYNDTPSLLSLIKGEASLPHQYEFGYEVFLSICKLFHMSFWLMSAVISIIYFAVIHKLFKNIQTHRTLALCILVALEFNLIFATFRQCMAVSFFILMYLAYNEKNYIRMLLCCIITASMHKSGLFFGFGGLLFLLLKDVKIKPSSYLCLMFTMLFIALLPIEWLIQWLAAYTSSDAAVTSIINDDTTLLSIQYHLMFFQRVQPILPLYMICFMGMYAMQNRTPIMNKINIVLFLGLVLVAFLYPFYPMIWRLRSYFIPFLIVYLFNTLQSTEENNLITKNAFLQKNHTLISQLSYAFIFMFCCYTIVSCYRNQNLHKSGIYEMCTIFDLRHEKYKGELKEKQLKKAKTYWATERLVRPNN